MGSDMTRGAGIGLSFQPFAWALGRVDTRGGWRMWAFGPLYLAVRA